jgi:hypothetical protein
MLRKLIFISSVSLLLVACGDESITESTSNAVDSAVEMASDAVGATTEAAGDVVEGATEMASDLADATSEAVDDVVEEATE